MPPFLTAWRRVDEACKERDTYKNWADFWCAKAKKSETQARDLEAEIAKLRGSVERLQGELAQRDEYIDLLEKVWGGTL